MGLDYTVTVVNITKDDQFKPDFLRISPNNKIPAIIDPNGPNSAPISVFESGAILLYLAEKSGQFIPTDPARRISMLEWLMFQMGGFGPMPGQVHHFIGLTSEEDKRYGLQRFMTETRRLYRVMNDRLADRAFFADELSIADFAILGWAWRHPRHQVELSDFPNFKRWYETMMARPAVQRGFSVALK
jgi:GST-like protein